VALLVIGYLAVYLLIFLPRGTVASAMAEMPAEIHERRILGTELLWAFGVGVSIAATSRMIVFTAISRDINPPATSNASIPRRCICRASSPTQSRDHSWRRTAGHGARHRNAVHVRSALHRRSRGRPSRCALRVTDVISRLLITGTNCEHHGGAGLCRAGAHRVHQHR
jgi:hypothetical protein